jgi:hypothetical protein
MISEAQQSAAGSFPSCSRPSGSVLRTPP